MPIVNYVREHIRFMEYATDEHLTSGERLLWYALMHIMNQRAQGKVWPDEFIRISNDRLLSYCPMKYDTIASARNSLKQRGLIEFQPGEKNKKSPAYRMVYFYPEYIAPESGADNTHCYPNNSEYKGVNMGCNIGYNTRGNFGSNFGCNSGDISINDIDRRLPDVFQRDYDEEDKKQEQLYARARAEAETAWKSCFGKTPTPSMVHQLAWRTVDLKFDDGVLSKAIELAASKGASSPMEYIYAVLSDWASNKVRSAQDVDEYAFIFDAMNGKSVTGMTAIDAYEAAKAFRQDRETPEEREAREEYEEELEEKRRKRAAEISGNKEERERMEYQREKEKLDRRYGVTE